MVNNRYSRNEGDSFLFQEECKFRTRLNNCTYGSPCQKQIYRNIDKGEQIPYCRPVIAVSVEPFITDGSIDIIVVKD